MTSSRWMCSRHRAVFGLTFFLFRIRNSYARPFSPAPYSVSPEVSLLDIDYSYLFAGDFNIHNSATDPSRLLSSREQTESAPYFNRAADLGFTLLNTSGIYTRFPLTGTHRPSAIDMAFANPQLFPTVPSWDMSTLPSTGSDHLPILISLCPPSPHNDKPRPRWQEVDWPSLTKNLKKWMVPPPRETSSPKQLHQWFSSALATLSTIIEPTAPRSHPAPRSKPWWTPLHTTLRKEYTKATHPAKETQPLDTFRKVRQSKLGYFISIKRATARYWAHLLAKTSPSNIWTAKQLVARGKTHRFPSPPRRLRPRLRQQHAAGPHLPPQGCPTPQRTTKEDLIHSLPIQR